MLGDPDSWAPGHPQKGPAVVVVRVVASLGGVAVLGPGPPLQTAPQGGNWQVGPRPGGYPEVSLPGSQASFGSGFAGLTGAVQWIGQVHSAVAWQGAHPKGPVCHWHLHAAED